jgi:hypothetical protein
VQNATTETANAVFLRCNWVPSSLMRNASVDDLRVKSGVTMMQGV